MKTHVTTTPGQHSVERLAYNSKEAAAALGGISQVTLWRLVKRGLIRPSKACRIPLFPIPEIERFLRDTAAAAPEGSKP